MSVKVGMREAEYHANPALSVSGAKLLLPPSCPARFRYTMDNPRQNKAVFDFGHAAHGLVLGVGEPVEVIVADDWRSAAAKACRDAAYAAGKVPLLVAEWAQVEAMAHAITADPIARALFTDGDAERSFFWYDDTFAIDRRARLDWMTEHNGRFTIVDYKTTVSANLGSVSKSVANFGYHMQAAWYIDAVREAGFDDDPAFLFVFQEKTAPYLVTVVELDAPAVDMGRARNDLAMSVFARCTAEGFWPGYSDHIAQVSLPGWATRGAS